MRTGLLVLVAAGLIGLAACAGPDPARREAAIARDLRAARLALTGDRPSEALMLYREVLRVEPTHVPAVAGAARARLALGERAAARAGLDAALATPQALEPAGAVLWRVRAEVRASEGDHDGALADLERSLGLQPRSRSALTLRGDLLARAGRHDEAVRDWEAVGRIDPGSRDAARIGRSQAAAGRHAEAAATLRQAAGQSLGDGTVSLDLYLAARQAGEPAGAARAELARHRALFKADAWPVPLLDRYLGRVDDGAVLAAAARGGRHAEGRQAMARRYLDALRQVDAGGTS